jgi:threonine dehydratase
VGLRGRIRRPLGPTRRPTDLDSPVASAGTDRLRGVSVRVFPAIVARGKVAARGDSRLVSLDTNMLSEGLVQEAIAFLRGRIRRTPMELSPALSAIVGVPVWLKLEFLQITGSFKLRGALFKMARLTETERRRGFVTSSAGNHGKAVAYAATQMGVHTVVCVPKNVDEAKHRGILDLGADVRLSPFAGYDKTEDWAMTITRA